MKDNICRICEKQALSRIIDFGQQPIVHHLLSDPESEEYLHPLTINICSACGIATIQEPCPPEKLYLDYNYNFSSWKSEPHRRKEIKMMIKALGRLPGSIFEIGCNDGSFLSEFNLDQEATIVGLEPNPHPAKLAEDKGVIVINEFLSPRIIKEMTDQYSTFDLVVARQVLEHLQDMSLFFDSLHALVDENGYVFIDVPDSETGFALGDSSIIWDEHVSYFCEASLVNLFLENGFELVDLEKFNFSGGILACLFRKNDSSKAGEQNKQIMNFVSIANAYEDKILSYKKRMIQLIESFKTKEFLVVLYGVGCRGSMFVNGLDLAQMIDFAVDDQKERHGKYMAGSHLLIQPSEKLTDYPEKILILLAVSHENNEKVKTRIRSILPEGRWEAVSVCSPSDIAREVETALKALD